MRYAENVTGSDSTKLKYLGWGGRRPASALEPPGQTRSLEAPRQGAGWIFLDWKAPDEGGKVTAYKVQRREEDPPGPDRGRQARPSGRKPAPSPANRAASSSCSAWASHR
uniref:Fibronectin type III domain-containing protein n=1 Tax=Candidatus Kentrum sp. SD TaxID=2126332 RepID=A0A451BI36_9GAMM|nr:MAG: hypothetical protein BECKSD772D_GA0070982_100377 [Candidatus Kentron sp. SD]